MNLEVIVMIIGIFLTNCCIILAAWIKMRTDIAAINVQIEGIKTRVIDVELDHKEENKSLHLKVERFSEVNNKQHEDISDKIDSIKESLNAFKLQIITQLK